MSPAAHRFAWLENALDALMPSGMPRFMPYSVAAFFNLFLEKTLMLLRLVWREDDIDLTALPARSALFVSATRERGIRLTAIKGPFGYTGHFLMYVPGSKKAYRFEGLPNVEWMNGPRAAYADDKWKVKQILKKNGFPVADGRTFWQWNRGAAMRYGVQSLGFPLVVKPRNGSVARHVTVGIRSSEELDAALRSAFSYSPVAIVEKHVPGFVHRLTVADHDTVACVRQLPAHVVGDGENTIISLVVQKNARPERHVHAGVKSFFHPITITQRTEEVLQRQHYTLTDVPRPAVRVWLSDDPFMRNGGDLEEVTDHVHPDNRALAQDVADLFGMKLVALDLICEDIARSWKDQRCAILELNSLPSIEMHHHPSYGTPQDVAGAIADMALRYYR